MKARGILLWKNVTVGDETRRPERGSATRVRWGRHQAIPQPFHWAPHVARGHVRLHGKLHGEGGATLLSILNGLPQPEAGGSYDELYVHPLASIYQNDQSLADLFASNGASEICGPSALAEVLLYLKHNHLPQYPALFENELPAGYKNSDVVHKLFNLCGTNRDTGTNTIQLRACAAKAVDDATYPQAILYVQGAWSRDDGHGAPIAPLHLRQVSTTNYSDGSDPATADRAVVLLFGWYTRDTYQRVGGHFVALAGFDEHDSSAFYVTNPLIDYGEGMPFSKLILEPVSADAKGVPIPNMYQTEHLFGDSAGIVAVLENMTVVLPGLNAVNVVSTQPAQPPPSQVAPAVAIDPGAAPPAAAGSAPAPK
jgi:hypothetical protein